MSSVYMNPLVDNPKKKKKKKKRKYNIGISKPRNKYKSWLVLAVECIYIKHKVPPKS